MPTSINFSVNKRFKGFTLVEMIIVISIISLLAMIAVASFANFQTKGRDAKRKSDLASVQGALEQYHADEGVYPLAMTPGGQISSASRTYLQKVPEDPQKNSGNPDYTYDKLPSTCDNSANNKCFKYCLYAALENPAVPNELSSCAIKTSYNYAVAEP